MRNSIFWLLHKYIAYTPCSFEGIEKQLLNEENFSFFKFSSLKSGHQILRLSFNLTLIKLLQIDIIKLNVKGVKNYIEIKLRFSNLLLLVYFFQLIMSLIFLTEAILYLESDIIRFFLMILPIVIYIIAMINFLLFKSYALIRIKEKGIVIEKKKLTSNK
ncbi:hypothetical protein ACFOUP_08865 [Belliella kenyensis]|uniref:Uncharacterized protein n=1 Tax=Belliella kenyensis TaxID=1472724 RepID=A0ABV8EKR0_9BACT|nr:hypothetical protein [Belliella kenyensis]MCH7403871.1 hypothetical protein [Belliella kenyensis]MDN3604868.1 hypothetical protein [Belliella kenyensis]